MFFATLKLWYFRGIYVLLGLFIIPRQGNTCKKMMVWSIT
jgi:hypothetical protein